MPRSYLKTDIGMRRSMNQDYVFASDEPLGELSCLYLVADGMGGHQAGDLASDCTVNTIVDYIRSTEKGNAEELLRDAIRRANSEVRRKAASRPEFYGMGTTIVGCTICGDTLLVANVGDSRLYVFGENGLRQITVDHSLVEEMVRAGTLERKFARVHPERNVITRAVGAEEGVKVDFFTVPLSECGLILLCSDGLTTMMEDSEIESVLRMDAPLMDKVMTLVTGANKAGGKDNISVVLVDASPNAGKEN
ncbi:MAG TPA: Stp1/IreP family PP2C-type Ser/Thr phosphatase [Lachnospiraceae bacterium]|nr:Stp1/IreP family PP2C-type Ser/Thr phosphatase [Lachnospiraceae bacterium]